MKYLNVYKHYKNNKFYKVYDEGHIQINDVWIPCVMYKDLYNRKFCRPTQEFNRKFSIITNEDDIADGNEDW